MLHFGEHAIQQMGLIVETSSQCFEWRRLRLDEMDMKEGYGLTMPKVEAFYKQCQLMVRAYI
ncbi:hypothetical protein IEQ34_017072 [Dendrobium chrysotoxum]|uniref:Uncharacterized protein n=1 Tax=Dendrobium chrysotoxum TaxID=161865 RepID=A0AAV7GIA6_DENCH|nr:hypothetical protein IEQ34_017072 [Dendrobium chrysotoxum]